MSKKEFKDKALLITYAVVLFILLLNMSFIMGLLKYLSGLLAPFITGAIMAFVLNVLVKIYENGIFKKLKAKRALSVISSIVTVLALIVFMLGILIPQVKNAGEIFLENIPEYEENITLIGEKMGISSEKLDYVNLANIDWKKEVTKFVSDNRDHILKFSMGFANSVIGIVTNAFIGLVFAIYILLDKERLLRQFSSILKKMCNKKVFDKLMQIGSLSSLTFGNFVKVQCLEAFILGFLCFIGMLLLRLPYAATIAVLVGFTALIPIFGAFIGCIIGAFLIFMISPIKSIIFILFFLILQQIEGNFIYPKVVGGKIGLPSIWVLVAVTIGGAVGGILGMLIGVPLVSVIYSLLRIYVNDEDKPSKRKKKGGKNEEIPTN